MKTISILIGLLVPIGVCASVDLQEPVVTISDSNLKVILLGTAGGPTTNAQRLGISTLVLAGPEKLLFDCGRSLTTGMARPSINPADPARLWTKGFPPTASRSSRPTFAKASSMRRMASQSRRFLVDHGPIKPAFGYRVDYRGRSVVMSRDTKPSDNLVKFARGVDVLIHEVGRSKQDPALIGPPDELLQNSRQTRGQARTIADHHGLAKT